MFRSATSDVVWYGSVNDTQSVVTLKKCLEKNDFKYCRFDQFVRLDFDCSFSMNILQLNVKTHLGLSCNDIMAPLKYLAFGLNFHI